MALLSLRMGNRASLGGGQHRSKSKSKSSESGGEELAVCCSSCLCSSVPQPSAAF